MGWKVWERWIGCVVIKKKSKSVGEKWEENWELTKKEGNVWGIPQFLLSKIHTKVQCQPPFHLPKQASNLATPSLPLQPVRPTPWVSIHLIFAIYHHASCFARPIRIRLEEILLLLDSFIIKHNDGNVDWIKLFVSSIFEIVELLNGLDKWAIDQIYRDVTTVCYNEAVKVRLYTAFWRWRWTWQA